MNVKMSVLVGAVVTMMVLAVAPASAAGGAESKDVKIARAMSAAPAAISGQATIMDADGTMLRQGSNGWTCMPDSTPGDKAPMCNDALWMKLMKAVAAKAPFEADGIGISYMLQGDVGAGVSNSDPYHPDPKSAKDYTETGPHVMIVVPKAMLEGITDDPKSGGPYVMWGKTPYAHIMVPVASKK